MRAYLYLLLPPLAQVIDSPTNYYLVLELAARGDLGGLLAKKGPLAEAEAAKYFVQARAPRPTRT